MTDKAAILAQCESLGRNCEFGLVQRSAALEPISLLRWAGAETSDLIEALRNDFADLAEEVDGLHAPDAGPLTERHWWLTCRRYRILFNTDERPSEVSADQAAAKVRRRLRWLARKLMEDIRTGEKLFVYSSADFTDPLDGLPLIDAFRAAGGHGPLLIVASGVAQGLTPIDHNTFGAVLPKLTPMGSATWLIQSDWDDLLPSIADIVRKFALS